jgi:hypothetical protein
VGGGKRITYNIFMTIMVPCIANKKNISPGDVIEHLSQSMGVRAMYNASEGPDLVSLLRRACPAAPQPVV